MVQLANARRPSRRRRFGAAAAIGCGVIGVTTAVFAWAAPPPASSAAAPAAGAAARPAATGGAGAAAAPAGTHDVVENYPDGKLHIRYQTDAAGLKTGPYVELFPNGRPKVRGSYVADKKQGVWTTLDQAGKTLESAGYSKGLLEGPYQWTADNGSASMRTTYHLGSYAGPVTVLGERGRLILMARYPRPLDEIRKQWAALYPATIEPAKFAKEPNLSPPYVAGALAPETLQEALKVTKLYRYLSGLQWQNVTLDPSASDKAQHGAVLLNKVGSLTHTPGKPADMDDAFFKLAYAGCNESNIHQGHHDVIHAIRGFMDDSDASNIGKVGHRRWILFPPLKHVGFGNAGVFTAMHVIEGWQEVPKFDFFAFPAEGYYPLQLVESHYAWSVHIHGSRVQQPGSDVKVSVSLLDEHFQLQKEFVTNVAARIEDNHGIYVIVFKPDFGKGPLEPGKYWVQVAGLKTPKGAPDPLSYVVELVEMPTATASGEDHEKAANAPTSATPSPASKPALARPAGTKR